MTNVTIALTDDAARWARTQAAERNTSLSRWVEELVDREMEREEGYRAARESFFSVEPQPLWQPGTPLPSRDELHDRDGLR